MTNGNTNLISAGAGIASRNKRYVVWFYLLNLVLAHFGAGAFSMSVHGMLDHSLIAGKLLHGFDAAVFLEMLIRPEFGPAASSAMPAMAFAILFFLLTLLFMPGVLLGYASDHRLPREEFYRACGHNVWRFVRLLLFFIIIAGPIAAILFGLQAALTKAADQSTNEMLPFYTQLACLTVIFLIMSAVRAWFDLAEADIVVGDHAAVRKSVAYGFRNARPNLPQLVGAYVVIAIIALAVLVAGIALWEMIVPAASVFGAFLISELILFLLLAARFWQRAVAVAFHLQQLAATPVLEMPLATALPASQPGTGA